MGVRGKHEGPDEELYIYIVDASATGHPDSTSIDPRRYTLRNPYTDPDAHGLRETNAGYPPPELGKQRIGVKARSAPL
jgi:hypothetical protein